MPTEHHSDDEFDDIMSGIMHGASSGRLPPPPPKTTKPEPGIGSRRQAKHVVPDHIAHPITSSQPEPQIVSKKTKKAKRQKKARRSGLKVFFWALLILIIGAGIGYGLWLGPVGTLVNGTSPFNAEVKTSVKFPLYYPTALPGGYHIDKSAMQPAANGVMVYAISNGDIHIAVTMQKKPDGLSLDPVLKNYQDVGKVTTPVGEADVAFDKENNTLVAHVLAPQTWMIFSADAGSMSRADFETILKSLKQG
jgi:hypothetical protein